MDNPLSRIKKREYTNGEITVIWQPGLCIHSGICFHTLPEVFKPRDRPWIQMDKADSLRIEAAVNACPTSAIAIKKQKPLHFMSIESTAPEGSKIVLISNGPAKVSGPCLITMADGSIVEKPNGVSLCRCGASANKPFCDGSHKTNGFVG